MFQDNQEIFVPSEIIDYAIEKRRDFHQHPELGFQEKRTASIIETELKKMGFLVKSHIAETGVIGIYNSELKRPVIMLRFDMDALPIEEENLVNYRSLNNNIMHACGHDAHMAIGLGLAKFISSHIKEVDATLKFVFQPAEEGLGGAERMIQDGALLDPKPDFCLGVHVWNEKPTNWIGITPGPMMAGAVTFKIEVQGKGGHGAIPNETRDPIIAASQIIQALQTIISRNISPLESGVVSICSIHGGNAFNVIPQKVELLGTLRYFKPEMQKIIISRFESIVNNTAIAFGCESSIEIQEITPPVINDQAVVEIILEHSHRSFPEKVFDTKYQSMGSEDYAFFLNEVPGCFIFMGAGNPSEKNRFGHHHPKFDIDEAVIQNSISFLYQAILSLINSKKVQA